MRTSSRRPPSALLAIGILMVTLGLGLLLYQSLASPGGTATARAEESAPEQP